MGVIQDKVDAIFKEFNVHKNYVKLIEQVVQGNTYSFGWQRETYNKAIQNKLGELEK